ncbi:Uncharacterised protein [Mycobacteroides abscessus subsp. abscessus]|nr:Uncharacterised protein [Mycobacteroides abscessus subsp. abscessus]
MEAMSRSRSSRPRRQLGHGKAGPSKWQRSAPGGGDISRVLEPAPRVERDRFGSWAVRFIPAVNARKTYTCPGCTRPIAPGTAHCVVWRTDHLFGDERGIEERRHWHLRCWETR